MDFTIEVERSLRVLDGAILVLCAVGGVQSQTITVDRQMKRYNVPRIAFVNKMDRAGANPWKIIDQLRKKLRLTTAAVQIPIGSENNFKGVVDIIRMKAYYNEGLKGEIVKIKDIPEELLPLVEEKRSELIENLANVDDEIGEIFLNEEIPTQSQLETAIRRATIANKFTPVFMGSAYHNTGVQPLLDGVVEYLPSPNEVPNTALDISRNESKVSLIPSSNLGTVALAFKLEEGRFGQLTYLRIYQGEIKRGSWVTNVRTGKKVKVPRVVRMHANEMEDVDSIGAGEICALFGVECASGDTFTDGSLKYTMTSMFVPAPVISLSIAPKGQESPNFSKALNRFQREDPTFRVHVDKESNQTIISGMGELHLDIYVERMKREYSVDTMTGKPEVAFRETIQSKVEFNYTHKKQSGGAGQFARIMGYIEPIKPEEREDMEDIDVEESTNKNQSGPKDVEFEDQTVGMNIPHQFIPAIEKGFIEAAQKGYLTGHPVTNVRFVLIDGLAHAVDSSELAFKLATQNAFREAFAKAQPQLLEPIMSVNVTAPSEYQGSLVALINKRKGTIKDSEITEEGVQIDAEVGLNDMFGFSTDLRSSTQGKGEFSMEYLKHQEVPTFIQDKLVEEYRKKRESKSKK